MEKIKDGGPAFPTSIPGCGTFPGLSIRDYFAAKALQGYISNAHYGKNEELRDAGLDEYSDRISMCAYTFADAMLRAREADNGNN